MNIDTLAAAPGLTGFRTVRLRVLSVVTALALVLAVFAMVQTRAEAAPSQATAAIALPSGGDSVSAQINFGQFVCPILLAIRNSFQNSPFFAFVVAAINPLLIAFGCVPSG